MTEAADIQAIGPVDTPLNMNEAAEALRAFAELPKEREAKAEAKAEPEAKADPEPEAEPQDAEPEQTVTVKIDGKEVEVSLTELKNGYQQQKASTERFMQAAETKKAAEAEVAKAREERATYAANLARMQARLEGEQQAHQAVNWDELIKTDPVEYLRQQHLANQRQATLQQVYGEQQKLAAQSKTEQEREMTAHLARQQAELLEKVPEWKDPAKSESEKAAIRDYLLNAGYEASDVASVTDARAVVLARKAMLFDQMIEKAKVASKKVSTLPTKVERPGGGEAPSIDGRSAAYQRLSKSGRVEDAAAVFATLL
jgi:hypothetical protein